MNPTKLHISLLGGVAIRKGETAVSKFASRKVDALLVYLACNPRPHPRETLATLLWPENDQNRALANLSVALSSLRKQLATAVIAERHTVAFNTEMDYVLDTAVFQQAINQAREEQQRRGKLSRANANLLKTAVALYQGDFLAGFNIRNAPEFEAWALLEQERLRQQFLAALADLIPFYAQRGQLDQAISHAQQLLGVDPLQENIHRQLMRLYAQDMQRPAALAQYEQCVRILDEELGVEPDEATNTLYQEIVEGRETTTADAPIATHQAPLHNLPAAANHFIGREDELAQIEQWLEDANGRLLTIIAPGGMGKTRLAQEAARAQVGQFADGVWMVSLVAYKELDEVITAVADAINLTLAGKEEPAHQLRNHLQDREILLVLDNLEHLLTSELLTLITQFTEQAPDLRLIVTSRERLRLQAETLLELTGLPYPDTPQSSISTPHSALSPYPAIQLFIDRARRLRSDYVADETAVSQLCQLVGGLPLALELAATWTRVLSVDEIVKEIQHSLNALSTTLHDVPARHRNIRAVIQSSWQMLPPDEQALFRQLAVFHGGFTHTAAQQVAHASLTQLMSLVDRSFLRLDEDQRFRRHPLLLQFAKEGLSTQPDEQAHVQTTHAHFFGNFVQKKAVDLQGGEATIALAALGADWENIRAGWQWALAQVDVELLDKFVQGMGAFLMERSRFIEGMTIFRESLALLQENEEETAVSSPIHVKIQAQLGNFLHEVGDFAAAEATLAEACKRARQHNLVTIRIESLRNLGEVIQDLGDRSRARPYLEEALQLCRTHPEKHDYQKLLVLNTLGKMGVFDGHYEQARRHFEEALRLAHNLGQTFRIASLHNNIAVIANAQENNKEAIQQYQLARDGFIAQQYDRGIAATSLNIGIAYVALAQYDEALINIQVAYEAYEKMGYKRGMVNSLSVLGMIYRKQGKRRQARHYLYESLRLAQTVGVGWSAVSTLVDVAELEMSYGELARAARLLAFTVQQSAIEATTLANAQKLLDDLRAELPEETVAEITTAVSSYTLDSLIDDLLNGRFS